MKRFIVHPEYKLPENIEQGFNDNKWVIALDSIISFKLTGQHIYFYLQDRKEVKWFFSKFEEADNFYRQLLDL